MEIVMTKISKLVLAAALAAATISPALAQSFNPGDGGMNSLPLQYQADGGRNRWTVPLTAPQSNVQVAAHKSAGSQLAAHVNKSAIKVASPRVARHGA
jgi:hypothetical protein